MGAIINRRKTVTSKKGKEYGYRVTQSGDLIKLTGKGYQKKTTKLAYKSGKLTAQGRAYLLRIDKRLDISEAQKEYLKAEFEIYRKNSINIGTDDFTVERFESHLQTTKIERMLYNFGMTSQDVAKELGVALSDVVNPDNWDFDNNLFTSKEGQWEITFDYDDINGFIFKKLN